MVQEVGRDQEERNGAKDRGGCGCQCQDCRASVHRPGV